MSEFRRRHGLEVIDRASGQYTCRCGAISLDAHDHRLHMRRSLRLDKAAARAMAAFIQGREETAEAFDRAADLIRRPVIEPAATPGKPCPICGGPTTFRPETNRRYCENEGCPMARHSREAPRGA